MAKVLDGHGSGFYTCPILARAGDADGPMVVYVEADRYAGVPSYESWWDVPVAEVSEEDGARTAREEYQRAHERQRHYLNAP